VSSGLYNGAAIMAGAWFIRTPRAPYYFILSFPLNSWMHVHGTRAGNCGHAKLCRRCMQRRRGRRASITVNRRCRCCWGGR